MGSVSAIGRRALLLSFELPWLTLTLFHFRKRAHQTLEKILREHEFDLDATDDDDDEDEENTKDIGITKRFMKPCLIRTFT